LTWLAVANSLVMDFLVRKKVSLHITNTILDSLPFPRLQRDDTRTVRLVGLAARLTCTGEEMRGFWNLLANDGLLPAVDRSATLPVFSAESERQGARDHIDAIVAFEIFGLERSEFSYVLDSFPIVERRDREKYGEYRTKRVVLEIYDAMAEATRTSQPYQTRLDPTPADAGVAHPDRGGSVVPLRPATCPQPEVRPAAAAAAMVPDLTAVAANHWARPHTLERGEIQASILAVLKAYGAPLDRRQARLAALLCLEPHLLAPQLDKAEKAHWARVVGTDAEKAATASIDATTQEWGAALTGLRGRERLIENLQQNTWASGTGIDAIDTRGWADGRAGFVVNVLRRLQAATQMDAIVLQLPTPIRKWLEHAA
jgi:hypothetical protein